VEESAQVGGAREDDAREQLWRAAFDTYYDAFFEEMIADSLISLWASLDEVAKILVALTASGSAVSGWVFWTQPGYRSLWLFLSGTAAVLSIVHTALGVPGRIKAHGEDKRRFTSLRMDLETFRYRMRAAPDFNMAEVSNEFLGYRTRYSENAQLACSDIIRMLSLEKKIQSRLNERLRNEIKKED